MCLGRNIYSSLGSRTVSGLYWVIYTIILNYQPTLHHSGISSVHNILSDFHFCVLSYVSMIFKLRLGGPMVLKKGAYIIKYGFDVICPLWLVKNDSLKCEGTWPQVIGKKNQAYAIIFVKSTKPYSGYIPANGIPFISKHRSFYSSFKWKPIWDRLLRRLVLNTPLSETFWIWSQLSKNNSDVETLFHHNI